MKNIIAIIDEVLAFDWSSSVNVNMLCRFETLAYTRICHIFIYTHTQGCINLFMLVYIHRYISVYTYIQVFCNVCVQNLHMCMHKKYKCVLFMQIYACLHVYIYIYLYVYMYKIFMFFICEHYICEHLKGIGYKDTQA